MLLEKLEEEYEKYYQKRVEPYMFSQEPGATWRSVFEKTYLHNDLKMFEINNTLYVKPIGIRSEAEMALIAKLAKYSHFHYAQDAFFQVRDCTCCQVYSGFNTINHYGAAPGLNSTPQYSAGNNTSINPSDATYRTVQYVAAPNALQQGGSNPGAPANLSAANLTATNLSMNGTKYDPRFEEQSFKNTRKIDLIRKLKSQVCSVFDFDVRLTWLSFLSFCMALACLDSLPYIQFIFYFCDLKSPCHVSS